jgi:hypothetical protein|nr:MAG: replication associated protein [Cressdnaviricota sp.]
MESNNRDDIIVIEDEADVVPTPAEEPKSNASARAIRWCGTDNDNRIPCWDMDKMRYLVWQTESGAKTGHLHTQFYVALKRRTSRNVVQAMLKMKRCHIEPARGNEKENRDYCTKVETRVDGTSGEFGEYKAGEGQGHRNDLDSAVTLIKQGCSMHTLALELPKTYLLHSNGMEKLALMIRPPPPAERDILVTVLWGPTGTGKTHRTRHHFPPEDLYVIPAGPKNAFDMYSGQTAILFDEFNSRDWTITDLNRHLDKWRDQLECRYRNQEAYWTDVVIASNTHPSTWFLDSAIPVSAALMDAFRRRLSHIVEVTAITDVVLFAREARLAEQLQPFQ